jgi:hypothetical protein
MFDFTARTTIRSEAEEVVLWALCAATGGEGKGKCDPDHCGCGAEARGILAALNAAGYVICHFRNVLVEEPQAR